MWANFRHKFRGKKKKEEEEEEEKNLDKIDEMLSKKGVTLWEIVKILFWIIHKRVFG